MYSKDEHQPDCLDIGIYGYVSTHKVMVVGDRELISALFQDYQYRVHHHEVFSLGSVKTCKRAAPHVSPEAWEEIESQLFCIPE